MSIFSDQEDIQGAGGIGFMRSQGVFSIFKSTTFINF